jgi:histidyl-tRNA synthetase
VQPVWRADRPQKGRFREFFQCDVDAIGSASMVIEVELLSAAVDVLTRLGFANFTVRLNHRKALKGLLESSGVPAGQHDEALVALDKLDKVGKEGVVAELVSKTRLQSAPAEALVQLFAAGESSTNAEILTRIRREMAKHDDGLAGVAELDSILALSEGTSAGGRLRLDPSLARGLSYYTGAIFEIAVPDLGGSLAGGGRYDDLIGMFLGDKVPACGISLGLERILVVMTERSMFPHDSHRACADVMVTIWNADKAADAIRLAGELRAEGLRTEVYPEPDKLGKQFKYADVRHIRFVTIVGDDEAARNEVAIKNLASGEQTTVPRVNVAQYLKGLCLVPEP